MLRRLSSASGKFACGQSGHSCSLAGNAQTKILHADSLYDRDGERHPRGSILIVSNTDKLLVREAELGMFNPFPRLQRFRRVPRESVLRQGHCRLAR